MESAIIDWIVTMVGVVGTIGACGTAIYLLPWTDGELEATERLGRAAVDGAKELSARVRPTARVLERPLLAGYPLR
jgi:hypothetical protein